MTNQQLLALKQKIKSKMPRFLRENYAALPRLENKTWRKPKGIHSKLRHGFAGHRNRVEPGYGTPAELRGIGKNGLKQTIVHNVQDLEKITPAKECIIIAKTGLKNKLAITKKAVEKKITIINLKTPAEFITATEQKIKQRKEVKSKQNKAKTEIQTEHNSAGHRKGEAQEKTDKAKKTEETPPETVEEKKNQEKKALDKLLTQKEQK